MVIDDGYITSDDSTIDMVIVSSIIDETIDFLKKGLDLIGKNFTEYMCINELWHLFDDKYFILGVMHVSLTELLDYFGVGLTEEEKNDIISRYSG